MTHLPFSGSAAPGGGCGAPEAALYFRPDGLVTTCCSGWHVLGSVHGPGRRSLREIWDGPERAELRAALDAGDFSLGCFECGRAHGAGQRAESLAFHFDRYLTDQPRRYPVMMDFALSNRCNLACVQCNGSFSSTIRSQREHREPLAAAYDDRFFEELDEFLPHLVRAQFKGGEPFLSNENRRIWDRMLELGNPPEICVTTNGTVWNDRVASYIEQLGFDLYVSVDAVDPEVLSAVRVGVDPDRFWDHVDRFRDVVRSTGRSITLGFCLMSLTWHQLGRFLQTVDRLEVFADVIWVDGPGEVNLLTMPRHELAAALVALEREDGDLHDLRPVSRALWVDALDRVRAALDRAEAESVVEVRSTPGHLFAERVGSAAAELGAPGARVLQVTYEQDTIVSVAPKAWSTWLRPETWVGHGLGETMMVIAADAGVSMRSSVESTEGGSHRVELEFSLPDGVRTLRGVHLPHPGAPGASTLLLAEASPV